MATGGIDKLCIVVIVAARSRKGWKWSRRQQYGQFSKRKKT
jgi:hypothetical protein